MLKIIKAGSSLGSFNWGSELAPDVILENGLTHALQVNKINFQVIGEIEKIGFKDKLNDLDCLVRLNRQIYNLATAQIKSTDQLLTLGGDHSISIGSMLASKTLEPNCSVLYIDAHPDCNNLTDTPTGNIHGMTLATVLGDSLYSQFKFNQKYTYDEVVIMAAKDIDNSERDYLAKHKIKMFEINDIVEKGIAKVLALALDYLGPTPLHISLDIDAIDELFAPGTMIKNQGGLTYREIKYLCQKLSEKEIKSIDLVEVNPKLDKQNQTLDLAVELVITLLGGKWSKYDQYLAKT